MQLRRLLAVALAVVVLAPVGAEGAPNAACPTARCRVIPTPVRGNAVLTSVAANSSKDIWAVGDAPLEPEKSMQGLVERWSGAGWDRVSTVSLAGQSMSLSAVVAVGIDDVWAVG